MTTAEWLACEMPSQMRGEIHCRRFAPHCWLRFDLACADRVRDLLDLPQYGALIDALATWLEDPNRDRFRSFHPEKHALNQAVRQSRWRDDSSYAAKTAAMRAVGAVGSGTLETSEMVCVAAGRRVGQPGLEKAVRAERSVHAHLMRCVFRSTLGAVVLNPSWRTDTAVSLAHTMYESHEFGAMPILADALQDAGCDTDDILSHCRDVSQVHVRGCWVVDLVLGKE